MNRWLSALVVVSLALALVGCRPPVDASAPYVQAPGADLQSQVEARDQRGAGRFD